MVVLETEMVGVTPYVERPGVPKGNEDESSDVARAGFVRVDLGRFTIQVAVVRFRIWL